MAKPIPSYLRLHVEEQDAPSAEWPAMQPLLDAFAKATGWPVQFMPELLTADRPVKCPPASGHLRVGSQPVESPRVELEQAQELAGSLDGLLRELQRTREALWRCEAELAAGVPVRARTDEEVHLAARLEAILRGGAEALACHASAIYMLDGATTALKMRSCWGLPKERLLEPTRPLRGAVADLEALVGHAVVIEDTSLLPHWRMPEPSFAAGVCVPVVSPSTPLGTLWVFSQVRRDFSSEETQLIEIIAGRVAAELEREVLLHETTQSRQLGRNLTNGQQWQRNRLPRFAPLLDAWDVAGWTHHAQPIGGDFHDWSVLPDGRLAIAVGSGHGELIEAALTSAAVQSAIKSHAVYRHNARQMVERVNETLWTSSTGSQFASLFYGLLDSEGATLHCSAAGRIHATLCRRQGFERLVETSRELGCELDGQFAMPRAKLRIGDMVVITTHTGESNGLTASRCESLLRSILADHPQADANEVAEKLQSRLENVLATQDCTAVVLKRRG